MIKIYKHLKNNLASFLEFLTSTKGSHKDKTVRSGYWIGLSSLIVRSLEFIRFIILARILMPEVFGVMSIILIVSNGLETLTQFNFKTVLIHKQQHIEESANTAWFLNIIRGCILALCVYVSAPYIAYFYNVSILSTAIKLYSVLFLLNGLSNVNTFLFEKELNFKKVAILKMAVSTLNIIISIYLAVIMRNIWALVYSYVIGACFEILLTYIIQTKRPKFYFNRRLAKEMFSYSLFITGSGILFFLTTKIDDALIGKVLGMSALGYYTYAYKLANLPSTYVTGAISQVMFPSYSSIQNNINQLRSVFLKVYTFISFISIPAAVGLFLAGDTIVYVILGHNWMPLVPALKVLCIFGLLSSLAGTTTPIFQAMGKPKIIFFVMLTKFIFILLLIYPLTSRYGIVGTAWAVTIPMIFEQLYLWHILSKALQFNIYNIVKTIKGPIGGSLAMIFPVILIKTILDFSIGALSIILAAGVASYIFAINVIDKNYYNELFRLFANRDSQGKQ
jgi:lipopolysaccharide exporter